MLRQHAESATPNINGKDNGLSGLRKAIVYHYVEWSKKENWCLNRNVKEYLRNMQANTEMRTEIRTVEPVSMMKKLLRPLFQGLLPQRANPGGQEQ